jgi:hypothetical protein
MLIQTHAYETQWKTHNLCLLTLTLTGHVKNYMFDGDFFSHVLFFFFSYPAHDP